MVLTHQGTLAVEHRRHHALLAWINSVFTLKRSGVSRLARRAAPTGIHQESASRIKSLLSLQRNTQLAHAYWRQALQPGDVALDATCGNGHDTIALAEFVGAPTTGTLIAVDIQETAVERTRDRLLELFQTKFGTVPLHMRTESTGGLVGYRLWTDTGFIAEIRQHPHEAIDRRLLQSWFRDRPNAPSKIKAAVYNLGYLPGPDSDKYIRTNAAGTVHSLMRVQKLIVPEGGIISISCYVGHDGGIEEETAVQQWAQALSTSSWTVVAHQWLNRPQAPSLIIAERFVSKKHLVARS